MDLNILPILVFGSCIGSFLNVVIYRLPRKISFIFKRSQCISCKRNLNVIDLFPILSWIVLRARCRYCGFFIPIRYPLIELTTSILFSLCLFSKGWKYDSIPSSFVLISGWILVSYVIALCFIDYDYMILPNSLNYSGALVGLFLIFYYEKCIAKTDIIFFFNHLSTYIFSLIGFLIFNILIKIIISKPALGNGDAKLFAMSGAWLGIEGLEVTIALSFLISAIFIVFGFISKRIKKGEYIPFGPFICVSILLVWFFSPTFWFEKLGDIFWWKYI
mgnify:CR=1 FL=1